MGGRTNRNLCRLDQRDGITKSTQDDIVRYKLRDEGIPRRIAEDPKENEHDQPRPEIDWRDKDAAMRLTRNRALRETEESVNNERQRHHHERIQLEGRDRMQMQ